MDNKNALKTGFYAKDMIAFRKGVENHLAAAEESLKRLEDDDLPTNTGGS